MAVRDAPRGDRKKMGGGLPLPGMGYFTANGATAGGGRAALDPLLPGEDAKKRYD